jgi:hypothetical protein
MQCLPLAPGGVIKLQARQLALEMLALDALKPAIPGIPQGAAFLVIEHENSIIGPARGAQGQGGSFQFTAVHDGQIGQGSVGQGDGTASNHQVGGLMPGK